MAQSEHPPRPKPEEDQEPKATVPEGLTALRRAFANAGKLKEGNENENGKKNGEKEGAKSATMRVQEEKPFDPHSVASAISVEEQKRNREARELLAAGGLIPPESVSELGVDIGSAKNPYLEDKNRRGIIQRDMDALAKRDESASQTPPVIATGKDAEVKASQAEGLTEENAVRTKGGREAVPAERRQESHADGSEYSESKEMPAPSKIFIREEDVPEYIKERFAHEGTLKENRGRFVEVMARAKEMFGRSNESVQNYLFRRKEDLDLRTKQLGSSGEGMVTGLLKKYNSLNWKTKLAVSGALIGASLASTVVMPASLASMVLLPMMIAGQRAIGAAGFMIARRAAIEAKIRANPEHALAKAGELRKYLNAAGEAMAYLALMGGAVAGVTYIAEELLHVSGPAHAMFERAKESWLGKMLGHDTTLAQPVVSATPGVSPVAPVAEAPHAVTSVPEVAATKGHGYEYMMKRLWEQLQERHLDPNDYPEGSDMRQLLEADSDSIDTVVHNIAGDPAHGFFHADGSSVRIDAGSHMTIVDGTIRLDGSIQAPTDAPVTPAYHSGAPAAPPERAVTSAEFLKSYDRVHDEPNATFAKDLEALQKGRVESAPALPQVETPTFEATDAGASAPAAATPEQGYVVDSSGAKVLDSQGEPVRTGSYEAPSESRVAHAASEQLTVRGPVEGIIPNAHGISVDPGVTHVYQTAKGLYVFGGDASKIDAFAQEYAQRNNVPVFVDKSYKLLGIINTPRVAEYAPDGTMIIHNGPLLVPDTKGFTRLIK